MSRLDIRIYPDPVLREVADEVEQVDQSVQRLLDDMAETMYGAKGIGLAATQVGEVRRVAVVDVSEARDERIDLVNPKIVWSAGKVPSEEGCLSIPDYRDTIQRKDQIVLQALNREGKEIELEAKGILAICLQHEVDHLDGVLFIDHLSRLKRELFKRWFKKRATQEE